MAAKVAREKLFDYLPAIFQEPEWRPTEESKICPICEETEKDPREHRNHLREFLEAFEKVLFGFEQKSPQHKSLEHEKGLGQKVERLHELFDPRTTPATFLPWLASWAALSLRAGMREDKQRELIAQIIPLYQIRGTKKYLEKLLELCDVPGSVSEVEIPPLQLGMHHQIGVDTYLGGGPPHFFRVSLLTSGLTAGAVEAQRQIAYEVIEMAKPAHTTYELTFASPRMQVGVHSTIGLDTVLSPAAA